MDELLTAFSKAGSLTAGPDGWVVAGCVIGAICALGLFGYCKWFKKGADNKALGEDIKNFFTMKGNFAADLATILYIYMTVKCVITSIEYLTLGGNSAFWNFLTALVGGVVWYRFVYECVMAVLKGLKKEK